jgi:hypothetical protein
MGKKAAKPDSGGDTLEINGAAPRSTALLVVLLLVGIAVGIALDMFLMPILLPGQEGSSQATCPPGPGLGEEAMSRAKACAAELTQERTQGEKERAILRTQVQDHKQDLMARQEQLEASQKELKAQRQELEASQNELAQARAQGEKERQTLLAEMDQLRQELVATTKQFEGGQGRSQTNQQELETSQKGEVPPATEVPPEQASQKGEVPPAKEVPPAQVALAVLNSAVVQACDAGKSDACSADLYEVLKTWRYALKQARDAFRGAPNDATNVIVQTLDDLEYLITSPPTEQFEENYQVLIGNSRHILGYLQGWLSEQPTARVDFGDPSIPPPARGLICDGSCPA